MIARSLCLTLATGAITPASAHPASRIYGELTATAERVSVAIPEDDHAPAYLSEHLRVLDRTGVRIDLSASHAERDGLKYPLSIQYASPSTRGRSAATTLILEQASRPSRPIVLTNHGDAARIDHPEATPPSSFSPRALFHVTSEHVQTPVTFRFPIAPLAPKSPTLDNEVISALSDTLRAKFQDSGFTDIRIDIRIPSADQAPDEALNTNLAWCELEAQMNVSTLDEPHHVRIPLEALSLMNLRVLVIAQDLTEYRGLVTLADPDVVIGATTSIGRARGKLDHPRNHDDTR